ARAERGSAARTQPIADCEEVTVAVVKRAEPHAVSQRATPHTQLDERLPRHVGWSVREPTQGRAQCPPRRQRRWCLELVIRDRLVGELGQQPIERVALLVDEG